MRNIVEKFTKKSINAHASIRSTYVDCFFHNENKFEAHQVLTCIDKGLTISSDKRRILTKEHYLKDPIKMISLFKDIPEAIENTIIIAKRCSFFLKEINHMKKKVMLKDSLLSWYFQKVNKNWNKQLRDINVNYHFYL